MTGYRLHGDGCLQSAAPKVQVACAGSHEFGLQRKRMTGDDDVGGDFTEIGDAAA
jgi:hypothetical protein